MVGTRVSVLVDGDNIGATHAESILGHAITLGRVDVARVYAAASQTSGWNAAPGYRLIHAGTGKNASDLLLSIDAMELALTSGIAMFVIATSDGDFSHLAIRLRERGLTATGMGEDKTPQVFRAACSNFVVLESGTSQISSRPLAAPKVRGDLKIRSVIAQHSQKGQGVRLVDLAQAMKAHHGTLISTLPDRNWRAYLSRRPTLYDIDPPSQQAMVRFRPEGFAQ